MSRLWFASVLALILVLLVTGASIYLLLSRECTCAQIDLRSQATQSLLESRG